MAGLEVVELLKIVLTYSSMSMYIFTSLNTFIYVNILKVCVHEMHLSLNIYKCTSPIKSGNKMKNCKKHSQYSGYIQISNFLKKK